MADLKMTKHAFGSKENIETAKAAGTIDAYDVLHLPVMLSLSHFLPALPVYN